MQIQNIVGHLVFSEDIMECKIKSDIILRSEII